MDVRIKRFQEFENVYHSTLYLKDDKDVDPINNSEQIKFNQINLYPSQNIAATCIMNDKNVIFAAPSSAGKTTFTYWAANYLIQRGKRFVFVVQDEFQRDVLFNELIRNDCNRTPGFNSIITVTDLLASIDGNDAKFTLLQTYIFDNIDQIQDKVVGPRLEELLIRLPKKKQYIFTATNFSNIESFARWIVALYQSPQRLIVVKERPFVFSLFISIPITLNDMKLFRMSRRQKQFEVDKTEFDKAMQSFFVPKNVPEVVNFAERCLSSFPVRQTFREMYKETSWPIIIVTFNDFNSQHFAWEIGKSFGLLAPIKKSEVTHVMAEFYERLDRESSEFALLDKLKSVFLNGVAYLNKSMSKIVREFVETLFHLELLKVLVVTEEVAINSSFRGKMVIVSSCRKFDGNSYRYLTNYEWQRLMCLTEKQASSLHAAKITLILDWKITLETLESIVMSKEDEMHSALMSCDNRILDEIADRSFYTYLKLSKLFVIKTETNTLTAQLNELQPLPYEKQIADYMQLKSDCEELAQQIDEQSFTQSNIIPYLNCGRLVKVVDEGKDYGIGIVIDYFMTPTTGEHNLHIALRISRDCKHDIHDFKLLTPPHADESKVPHPKDILPIYLIEIVKVPIECIKLVYRYRLRLPNDLMKDNFYFLYVLLNDIENRNISQKIQIDEPELNKLRAELKMKNSEYENHLLPKREGFETMLRDYNCHQERKRRIEEEREEFPQEVCEESTTH